MSSYYVEQPERTVTRATWNHMANGVAYSEKYAARNPQAQAPQPPQDPVAARTADMALAASNYADDDMSVAADAARDARFVLQELPEYQRQLQSMLADGSDATPDDVRAVVSQIKGYVDKRRAYLAPWLRNQDGRAGADGKNDAIRLAAAMDGSFMNSEAWAGAVAPAPGSHAGQVAAGRTAAQFLDDTSPEAIERAAKRVHGDLSRYGIDFDMAKQLVDPYSTDPKAKLFKDDYKKLSDLKAQAALNPVSTNIESSMAAVRRQMAVKSQLIQKYPDRILGDPGTAGRLFDAMGRMSAGTNGVLGATVSDRLVDGFYSARSIRPDLDPDDYVNRVTDNSAAALQAMAADGKMDGAANRKALGYAVALEHQASALGMAVPPEIASTFASVVEEATRLSGGLNLLSRLEDPAGAIATTTLARAGIAGGVDRLGQLAATRTAIDNVRLSEYIPAVADRSGKIIVPERRDMTFADDLKDFAASRMLTYANTVDWGTAVSEFSRQATQKEILAVDGADDGFAARVPYQQVLRDVEDRVFTRLGGTPDARAMCAPIAEFTVDRLLGRGPQITLREFLESRDGIHVAGPDGKPVAVTPPQYAAVPETADQHDIGLATALRDAPERVIPPSGADKADGPRRDAMVKLGEAMVAANGRPNNYDAQWNLAKATGNMMLELRGSGEAGKTFRAFDKYWEDGTMVVLSGLDNDFKEKTVRRAFQQVHQILDEFEKGNGRKNIDAVMQLVQIAPSVLSRRVDLDQAGVGPGLPPPYASGSLSWERVAQVGTPAYSPYIGRASTHAHLNAGAVVATFEHALKSCGINPEQVKTREGAMAAMKSLNAQITRDSSVLDEDNRIVGVDGRLAIGAVLSRRQQQAIRTTRVPLDNPTPDELAARKALELLSPSGDAVRRFTDRMQRHLESQGKTGGELDAQLAYFSEQARQRYAAGGAAGLSSFAKEALSRRQWYLPPAATSAGGPYTRLRDKDGRSMLTEEQALALVRSSGRPNATSEDIRAWAMQGPSSEKEWMSTVQKMALQGNAADLKQQQNNDWNTGGG